jgi:hypothetical protein
MNLLTRLILNVKRALDNDLHLVVRVRVDEWCALLQAIEASRDGLVGVDLVTKKSLAPHKSRLTLSM